MKSATIISVPVTDQQRAKEFYLKLGLTLITESQMGNDQVWIQLAFPAGGATLTLVNWFEKMQPGSMHGLVISTDDIEKDIEELKTKGIIIGAIDHTPWGKFASIKDPDGNSMNLHQN